MKLLGLRYGSEHSIFWFEDGHSKNLNSYKKFAILSVAFKLRHQYIRWATDNIWNLQKTFELETIRVYVLSTSFNNISPCFDDIFSILNQQFKILPSSAYTYLETAGKTYANLPQPNFSEVEFCDELLL